MVSEDADSVSEEELISVPFSDAASEEPELAVSEETSEFVLCVATLEVPDWGVLELRPEVCPQAVMVSITHPIKSKLLNFIFLPSFSCINLFTDIITCFRLNVNNLKQVRYTSWI